MVLVAQVTAPVREMDVPTADEKRTMTGGQALVAMLKRQGVETIFGLPGVQLDGLFEALYDERDAIRVVHTRHEQATAYMADGYARATGREGVCLVVPGPGLLNASAGLSTAYACNSPVLCLTGQIRSDLIEFGRGLLHEIPHQLEMVRSVTKHAARATTPEAIPSTIQEAFRQLRSGRPRPVEVEVPPDTLFAKAEVELLPPFGPRERPAGDPDLIDRAAKLLGEAERPLIFAGGGILRSGAWDELLALAELLQAPVILTSNAKGAISDRHYLAQSQLAERELSPRADVVFAVGTRFVGVVGEPRQTVPGQTFIRLDVDDEEIERNQPADLAILADAKAGLAELADRATRYNRSRPSRESELVALKREIDERVNALQPQAGFAHAIRAELPDEGIIVGEMTQLGYWSNLGLPIYQPNTYLTPGYQGTLGFGFTTAMGAKVGRPEVPVVSINGDGGFGFTLNELSTLVQHRIGLVTIVFNDNAYGNVRRIQNVDYNGRTIASDLVNPNYLKLADAFGVTGRRAETPAELRIALRESTKADEPTLIEVPVDAMPNPWTALGLR
ncbi:MAG: acetolactate synthase large subunit [Thermomicrobiales bacterium]|nr:acetolactate synthase large subunit [Thermomicrobiales bacterium]